MTLAKLEFLLGGLPIGTQPSLKFWVFQVSLSGITRNEQGEAPVFADLNTLVAERDEAKVAEACLAFRTEYADTLLQLSTVQQFAINGIITLEQARSTLHDARILLGALRIRIEQIPPPVKAPVDQPEELVHHPEASEGPTIIKG